jgi:hypothetical protein
MIEPLKDHFRDLSFIWQFTPGKRLQLVTFNCLFLNIKKKTACLCLY